MNCNNLYIDIGGGLGDAINNYLSNGIDGMPSTAFIKSLWFQRIGEIKRYSCETRISVLLSSHNPSSKELLKYDPYIDCVEQFRYSVTDCAKDFKKWFKINKDAKSIESVFNWQDFNVVREPSIYTDEKDDMMISCIEKPYIVIHPFARKSVREVFLADNCVSIAEELLGAGFNVVIVGSSYDLLLEGAEESVSEELSYKGCDGIFNYVNKASIRVAAKLCMNADGFISNHSALTQAAWAKGVKSICVLPTDRAHVEFFKGNHPVTWGLHQPFVKSIYSDGSKGSVNIKRDIVEYFN